MPVGRFKINVQESEATERYYYGLPNCMMVILPDPDGACADILQAERKKAIRAREEILGFQKACESVRDIEGARFFRDEAAYHMRRQRAAGFILPWFMCEPPKDCVETAPTLWPTGLANELDALIGLLTLRPLSPPP